MILTTMAAGNLEGEREREFFLDGEREIETESSRSGPWGASARVATLAGVTEKMAHHFVGPTVSKLRDA